MVKKGRGRPRKSASMPQPTNTHTGTPQPQHSAAASPSTGKQLATDEREMQLAGPAMITSAEVRPDFTNPKSTELGIPAKEPRQLWTDVITACHSSHYMIVVSMLHSSANVYDITGCRADGFEMNWVDAFVTMVSRMIKAKEKVKD
ncbi:hypothetical protein P8452_15306 [Trifolium repens]|nr:hypothetical protein P8452_15306 [Trifolium repens]